MEGATETTAKKLQRRLALRGVSGSDIKFEHIDNIYPMQKKTRGCPDFTKLPEILGCVSPADAQEPVCAVIVETREHANLVFSIQNLHRELGLPVQVFHGPANKAELVTALSDLIKEGAVRLTNLQLDRLEAAEYNALLLSPEFWHAIPAKERVLFFQPDSIVCANRQYRLEDFSDLDLVGAYWPNKRPVGFCINGGSGGFSMRNKALALECLERFPPGFWQGGEDGYFGFHVELVGGKVATPTRCSMFATQHVFQYKSLGAHRISALNEEDLRAFLEYCPDACRLLPAENRKNTKADMSKSKPKHDPDKPILAYKLNLWEAEDRRQGGRMEEIFFAGEGRLAHKWIDYLPIYERYFSPILGKDITFLEIGVGQGGSLDMWRTYFGHSATICGIDVNPVCANRVTAPNLVRIGSQDDPVFLQHVLEEIGLPDIVLDDGSHIAEEQLASFRVLWPRLNDGGLYIIEDTHTAYWEEFGGGIQKEGTAVDLAKRLIDDMHGWFHPNAPHYAAKDEIAGVHVHESIIVIEKQKKKQPGHIQIGDKPR